MQTPAKRQNLLPCLACLFTTWLAAGFPSPCKPTTHGQVSNLLLKARALGQPNLIIAHSQDWLLLSVFYRNSTLRTASTTYQWRPKQRLATFLLPFLSIFRSNDPSYMNHIVCRHYNTNYGCGKGLNEVYITRQLLSKHMKTCKGLPKRATDMGTMEDKDGTVTSSSKDGAVVSSSKDGKVGKKKKQRSKDLLSNSQPLPQSSQMSSQVSPCCSECTKKKSTATPQKSGSSGQSSSKKEEKCSSSHKHLGKDKSSKDKQSSKDKHHGKDKPSMNKPGKKKK